MSESPRPWPGEKRNGPDAETIITCPECGAVYDRRYLSETCPADKENRRLCVVCKTRLEMMGMGKLSAISGQRSARIRRDAF